jgi:hypothetical protein
MRSVRFASIVGSRLALVLVVVVLVVVDGAVVVVVVVQPTIAAIHTPKTSGINFFMRPVYQKGDRMSRNSNGRFIAPGPRRASARS